MKGKLLMFIMLLCSLPTFAQKTSGELRGRIVDSELKGPIQDVLVVLRGHNYSTLTNEKGEFVFTDLEGATDILFLSSAKVVGKELPVRFNSYGVTIMDDVEVILAVNNRDQTLVTILDGDMLSEDDASGGLSQDVSPMVILTNDVYLNNVAYQLSNMRFKPRGYTNNYDQKYINGVSFNDQVRGVFNYSGIGALNDVTRNGDSGDYLAPNNFSFGDIGRSENINMRSGNYAQGSKLTASYTNRNYYSRAMFSYATGLRDDGWAFNMSVGGRYADRGAIPGTLYQNLAFAIGAEKQWAEGRHSLSFITFGSPVKRGQQSSSFDEVYKLRDNNLYNPNWGYQNGKRRNSKVVRAWDPTAVLSHVWKINETMTLTSGVGTHYNRYGGTALNWYNAPDPRPDYYRYLPSYYSDDATKDYYTYLWESNDTKTTQVDWDRMYNVNDMARRSGDGAALYMLEERRKDLFETSINSTFKADLSNNRKLLAGIGLKNSQSYQFTTVKDLMGAEYVLDIDKFAERDFPGDPTTSQNDLRKPNRKAYKGDRFGYDFKFNINSANLWVQNVYKYRYVDFYYGAKLGYTEFYRKGFMQNGRYADNSFGRGERHSFVDYALKGGLTVKIDGRNYITGNVAYLTQAPFVDQAYVSPRIADVTSNNLKSGRILSTDINYVFSMPNFQGRVSVFQTNFYDMMQKTSYYNDSEKTFVNHVLDGMNKTHRGVEVGMNYKLDDNWSFDLAGTMAEYFYSNNPNGTISSENGKVKDVEEKVYLNDYYVGGTPQIAGTFGINYFNKMWFVNMNVNGFGRSYVDVAPIRRLASNYQGISPSSPEYEGYRTLTSQERFGTAFTVDLSIGKVFYLKNRRSVNFNFSLNNLLNRENIKTGGYEQGRSDNSNPNKFPNKYYYMQGINCFLNASYRF